MCGRFTLTSEIKELREHFSAVNNIEFQRSYNIAPSREIPVIKQENGDPHLSLCQWGLIPHWAKQSNYKAINARAETLKDKPYFREAFRKRRCLIPANGFYEWKKVNGEKQAYYFHLKNSPLFAFAGLWEYWGKEQRIESCAIITTAANSVMQPVHERMPVILTRENYADWLETGTESLLIPFPGDMRCHIVGKAVNNPRNDNKELVEPID